MSRGGGPAVPGGRPARRPAVPAVLLRLRPGGRRRRDRPRRPRRHARRPPRSSGQLIVAEVPSGLPPDARRGARPARRGEARRGRRRRTPTTPRGNARCSRTTATGSAGSASGAPAAGPMTGVFVDQFEHRVGRGRLRRGPGPQRGRALRRPSLTGARPGPARRLPPAHRGRTPIRRRGLAGPAAFAWCGHGVFSVSVTAVADSVDAAPRRRSAAVLAAAAGPAAAALRAHCPGVGLPVAAGPAAMCVVSAVTGALSTPCRHAASRRRPAGRPPSRRWCRGRRCRRTTGRR